VTAQPEIASAETAPAQGDSPEATVDNPAMPDESEPSAAPLADAAEDVDPEPSF
jgi:hypothetical protein